MSHQPERKEKNCLNCGTMVVGRYCHVCGQENIETRESFWSLTRHFVFDLLHFDGKFFSTLKYIFTRPGWVAREYCLGKRMSFLHPIRMYLFTSAVFFLVFFSVNEINLSGSDHLSAKDRMELADDYRERLKEDPNDSVSRKIIALLADTTREVTGAEIVALDPKPFLSKSGDRYGSLREYDSVQRRLPSDQRDSWLRRVLMRKTINLKEKHSNNAGEAFKIILESFLHRLPYMLFLSLPFFALILKLLYIRRKNFYYSDHAIFTIYHYIFSFILLLVLYGLRFLRNYSGWGFISFLTILVLIAWPLYLLLEMKNFYRQGWLKTTGKFLLLNLLGLLVILVLFATFLFFSLFEV